MALLSLLTYTLSAMWLTPYLVTHVGEAAFGLISLAGLFTLAVSIVTRNLSRAVNRFLTIELQKEKGRPQAIYSSAFVLYGLLILLQIPLFTLGLVFADWIFTIPPALKEDALILLACSAGCYLLSLASSVFGAAVYSLNRLDIGNGVIVVKLLVRLALIFSLFTIFGAKLRYIGYVDLLLQVASLGMSYLISRRLAPELKLDLRELDWSLLMPVFKMSFWTLVTQLGGLLYLRCDILIINRFISAEQAGRYAALLVIGNFIRKLADFGVAQLGPTITTYWAKNERVQLLKLLRLSITLLSSFLAIPVALVCIHGGDFLRLWLGESFAGLSGLLVLLVIHLFVNAGVQPLFMLQTTGNRVKVPGLVTFWMGLLNVGLSYVLGVTLGYGMWGVALATAVVLTLKNAFFTPIYGALIMEVGPRTFFVPLMRGSLLIGFVYLASFIPFGRLPFVDETSWPGFLFKCVVISILGALLIWKAFLSRDERSAVFSILPPPLRDFVPAILR